MKSYRNYNEPEWFRFHIVKPPCDGEYIVTCKDAIRATVLTYENGKWYNDARTTFEVIAWMFLPPAYVPYTQ